MLDTRKPVGLEREYIDAVITKTACEEKTSQIMQVIMMGIFDLICIGFTTKFVLQVMPELDLADIGELIMFVFVIVFFVAIIAGLTSSCIKIIVYKPWKQIRDNAFSEGYEVADVTVVRATKPGHSVTSYRVYDQGGEVLMKTIKEKKIENHVRGFAMLEGEALYVKLYGVEPGFLNQFVIPRYDSGHKYVEQILNISRG